MEVKKISRSKVRELCERGLTDSEIARELKCHYYTIWKIRNKELGLKSNCSSWRTIDRDKFWEDYQNGMSFDKMAEKYGYASAQNIKRAIGRIYLERGQE